MYTIEKNIPMPNKGKGKMTKVGEMRKVLIQMEVGDSFILPEIDYQIFGNAKRFIYIPGENRDYVARKINENEFRVFRTQ